MTLQEILTTTAHRPWQIPNQNWRFYQEWNNALFLSWQVPLHELEKHVPKTLEIDQFNGTPWVSLVAFTMEKIRPKNLPSFSPISDFDEINIRTYVKYNNKSGVHFLSIEGGKKISCFISKAISKLPYRFSTINRTKGQYRSKNRHFDDQLNITYTVGNKLKEKTALDSWLTERYALFQDTHNAINEFEIHHLEWPLHELTLHTLELDYPRFTELLSDRPQKTHYSNGVRVIAWDKTKKQN